MIITYHGKQYEITSELEAGEAELDLFDADNSDLEKTMEFSNEFLEDTMDLKNVIDLVGDKNENQV